jgi:CubicO group peptidase (beta-lactamase class C family)
MIIRYMAEKPLDFDPGQKYAYSNFGFCLLGRVIEKVTGQTYERYMQSFLQKHFGIRKMRIGRSLSQWQMPAESRYYAAGKAKAVFPSEHESVEWPYGGFCLESMDAHGGWISSAVDLARFGAVMDRQPTSKMLLPKSLETLYEKPAPPVARNAEGKMADSWYGCGWLVRPVANDGRANYWHDGSLPGTATLLVRRSDGLTWVALFNKRSEKKETPDAAVDGALHKAANQVTNWPAKDLFPAYGFRALN